jgi:putative tryptophan/tyrosine transport system substrate-binding protein
MGRRVFISSLACVVVVVALAAAAQTPPSPNRPRRVVWLQGGAPDTPDEQKEVDDALAGVGWIVGKNVLIDRRYVSFDALSRTAEDFVNAKVDLIIASGTPATLAAKNATTSIPILMWSAGDPVATGLVASLARPGGNVAGMAMLSPEQSVKRLSLIRELLPEIRRVGQLVESTNPGLRAERKQLEEAYRSVGMEPIFLDTARIAKFEDMLAEAVQRRAQALSMVDDALRASWIPQVFGAAIAVSLPTIVDDYRMLEAGALLSYESDPRELSHRDAVLFDKLLRGMKPADLPVEQPTKFILGINLKTAKALGITIPQTLLLRADILIK